MAKTKEPETFTLEEAHQVVLEHATAEGRCPQCGRRTDSDEAKLFDELRAEVAQARAERDEAQTQQRELEEAVNLGKAQLLEADERLKILRTKIAEGDI